MEEAYLYILNELGLQYRETVVLGVSGGPDSMALLDLFVRVAKTLDLKVICAHVNHNVRKESAYEKEFVENYCLLHNVVFETMRIENYGDDNFHNEARGKRYHYFKELVVKYHARFLFTAHHGDDLIESVLMRMVRGSTLKGYSGFAKIVDMGSFVVVRPLIHVTKKEILDYDKKHKISYVEDASNNKDVYTRNRFRKYIVPELKKEDDSVHDKFYKFSTILLDTYAYIEKQMKKTLRTVYPQNVLNIERFLEQDYIIQLNTLYYILERFYQDDLMLLTDRHVELFLNLIRSKKANAVLHLPNNVKAVKSYNEIHLEMTSLTSKEYEIELIEFANLPNGKNIEVVSGTKLNNNYVCKLDSSMVVLPLYIRTRKNGDKIDVKGMLGRKKVNDIFIDEKIPMALRDTWPLVIDSNGTIVWLPGLKKSKFDRSNEEKYDIILKYY